MTVPKQQDLVEVIIADHREVEAALDETRASGDARNRRALVDHVIAALVRHSVAEEQHLYPTVRSVLADGDAVADRDVTAHADAEQVMKRLERTDATDPVFAELVGSLIERVHRHIQGQERDLLPRLRSACEEAELRELGLKFVQSKKVAPTHPHPAAPDRPPANKVVDAGMGLIDRVRDAITRRDR